MKKILFICILFFSGIGLSQQFTVARVQYSGGGDWYGDPSSLPNLLSYLNEQTPMNPAPQTCFKCSDCFQQNIV